MVVARSPERGTEPGLQTVWLLPFPSAKTQRRAGLLEHKVKQQPWMVFYPPVEGF
jgi:hypothetical protein